MTFNQAVEEGLVGNSKYVVKQNQDVSVVDNGIKVRRYRPTKPTELSGNEKRMKRKKKLNYADFQFGSVGMLNTYV